MLVSRLPSAYHRSRALPRPTSYSPAQKSQRIAGELALSLPDSDVETVWLTMSAEERILYALHGCADGVPKWADTHRATALTLADLDLGLSRRRYALASLYQARGTASTHPHAHTPIRTRRPLM